MQITLNISDSEWELLEIAHISNFSSFSKQYPMFRLSATLNDNNRYYNITISRENLLKCTQKSQVFPALSPASPATVPVQVLDKSTLRGTSSHLYNIFLRNPLKEFTKEDIKPLVPVSKQTLDKHLRILVRDKFLHAEYREDHYVYSLESGF